MLVRIILLVLMISMKSAMSFASIGFVATQEQLDRLCVPLVLSTDNDKHWFYYKSILSFGLDSVEIQGEKITFIPKSEVLNWEDALNKYIMLKNINS